MKKTLITVTVAFLSVAGMAQNQDAKQNVNRDTMRKVVDLTSKLSINKDQILEALELSEPKKADFLKEFDASVNKFYDKHIDIYLEEFNQQDVNDILAFYDSPAGKKKTEKEQHIKEKTDLIIKDLESKIEAIVTNYPNSFTVTKSGSDTSQQPNQSAGQPSSQKASREEVQLIIANSNALKRINTTKKQALENTPKDKPDAFLAKLDIVIKEATDNYADVLIAAYSKEDVSAINAFCESPTGKKMTQKMEIIDKKRTPAMDVLKTEINAMVQKYMQ